jgi:iron complex outermembrane receptor protein
LGVPAGAEQANGQISVTTGGNPLLNPETADSYSVGFVWSPGFGSNTAWSERFDIEVTYYNHQLDGAIQAIDAQNQIDLCTGFLPDPAGSAPGPSSPFCQGITRASTGSINGFNNRLQNFGSVETDGFDFDFFWTLPQTDVGSFRVVWQNTWVNDYEEIDGLGSVQPRVVGLELNNSAIPEWTSNLSLRWSYGDFSASWAARHISDLTENCGDAASFAVCSDQTAGVNRLGSTTYQDVQLGWKAPWFKGTQFSLGVNNVFSKDPPICLSCSLNGYDASTYDLPGGRFVYARAEVKF